MPRTIEDGQRPHHLASAEEELAGAVLARRMVASFESAFATVPAASRRFLEVLKF
jgi:hypothetical protein